MANIYMIIGRYCNSQTISFNFPFLLLTFTNCATTPRPGAFEPRRGDEIVVADQFGHTGSPVVLWIGPGGYDAYRVERRFSPIEKSDWTHSTEEVRDLRSPSRYNMRRAKLTNKEIEHVHNKN